MLSINKVHIETGHSLDLRRNIEKRRLFKEDPKLWKAYRRLSENPPKLARLSRPKKQVADNPFFHVPTARNVDAFKCTCYHDTIQVLKRMSRELTNCPLDTNVSVVRIDAPRSYDRTVNAITKGFRANERRQLPWPTLLIRWQLKRIHPGYDVTTIRKILSKYGAIREIRMVSINSVMVIFQDVSTACDIMMAPGVGDIDNLLHPTWWHLAMRDKFVSSSKKGVSIKTDPFLK